MKTVQVLLDSNGVIVKREFVNEEDCTGSMGYIMGVDRSLKKHLLTKLKWIHHHLFDLIIRKNHAAQEQIILFGEDKFVLWQSQGLKHGWALLLNPK